MTYSATFLPFATSVLLLSSTATDGLAAKLTLEALAAQIAEQFNANPPRPADDFTTALKARSVGRNVIYSYIWNYRLDSSKQKIDQLVHDWGIEMIPQVCQNHLRDEAFKQGLSYTFIYYDLAQRKVAEYHVSNSTCTSMR